MHNVPEQCARVYEPLPRLLISWAYGQALESQKKYAEYFVEEDEEEEEEEEKEIPGETVWRGEGLIFCRGGRCARERKREKEMV